MIEAFANVPFLQEDGGALTPGYFVGHTTLDGFMEQIWRLRRWHFYGVLDLEHPINGVYNQINLTTYPGDAVPILQVENNHPGETTSAFADVDDIFLQWRKTRVFATSEIIDEGTGLATPDFDLWWGPRGAYSELSGGLDSQFYLLAHPNGDESFEIRTDEFVDSRLSAAFLNFDPDGVNSTVPLYETDDEDYEFTGTLILRPGGLYWPWNIDGDDTYDTTTGAELEDPVRLDTNGFPLTYMWQPPEP